MNEIDKLRKELECVCTSTNTNIAGIETLIQYYTCTCGWTEKKALIHTLGLFKNGTIDQIKLFGKNGEENEN